MTGKTKYTIFLGLLALYAVYLAVTGEWRQFTLLTMSFAVGYAVSLLLDWNTKSEEVFKTNGDCRWYFDKSQNINYWTLGYLCGNGEAIDITEAAQAAKTYARATGVPLDSVRIERITKSSHLKGFKVMFSSLPQKPVDGGMELENFWRFAD
jgi:hypothetical protein